MAKTFFFDLDGTIINDIYSFDESVPLMFEKLKKNGHRSFVCTGRGNRYVPKEILEHCSGMITLTGACAYYDGKQILNHTFSKAFIDRFLSEACSLGTNVYLENSERMAVIGDRKSFDEEETVMADLSGEVYDTPEEFYQVHKECLINKMNIRSKFTDHVKGLLEGDTNVEILDAGQGWSEIVQKGINKGTAIKEILSLLNISKNDTICFGDSGNDIAMFRECGLSVAVANADKTVQQAADLVIGSCEDRGVEEYLKKNGFLDQ